MRGRSEDRSVRECEFSRTEEFEIYYRAIDEQCWLEAKAVGQWANPNSNRKSSFKGTISYYTLKLYWIQDCEESGERARSVPKHARACLQLARCLQAPQISWHLLMASRRVLCSIWEWSSLSDTVLESCSTKHFDSGDGLAKGYQPSLWVPYWGMTTNEWRMKPYGRVNFPYIYSYSYYDGAIKMISSNERQAESPTKICIF